MLLNKKTFIWGAVTFIFMLLSYLLVLHPALTTLHRIQNKLSALQLQLTPEDLLQQQQAAQASLADELQTKHTKIESIYLNPQQLAQWLGFLAQLAAHYHVTLHSAQPLQTIHANFYQELPMHLQLSGTYQDLTTFVTALSELVPLFLTADFSLTTNKQAPLAKQLTLDLYVYAFAAKQNSIHKSAPFIAPVLEDPEIILSSDPFFKNASSLTVSENQLMNLNFQDIALRSVLQNIAESARVNIIVSDKVQGNISLHLQKVTWQEALNVILQSQGLGQRKISHSILVAPLSELLTYDKQQLQIQDELKNSQPLHTENFQLKYGKAQSYYDTLKNSTHTLLSPRGKVIVNSRTNFLLVEDTHDSLKRIRDYIAQTDIALRQVEIEARIVVVDKSYEQQLGIKWNVQGAPVSTAQASSGRGFNLDLSAGAIDGTQPGSIALATLASDVLIGLELSALEAEGNGEVLSSPRLLTADQQEALIEQGQEIPYQETTGTTGATTTSFKQAVLRLKVTPQIINEDKLLLRLEVNQDAKSRDISKDGVPLIDTRHISTNILINNGETVVLGGIYERSKSDAITRIPFMSDLPLIGNLFKHRRLSDNRTELLIFVTPRIVRE